MIVTDGFTDPAPLAAAARALRGRDVTVLVVAPAAQNDRGNLEAIATSPDLILEVDDFDDVAEMLLETISQIGVLPWHNN